MLPLLNEREPHGLELPVCGDGTFSMVKDEESILRQAIRALVSSSPLERALLYQFHLTEAIKKRTGA
jgi:hypothetical protein